MIVSMLERWVKGEAGKSTVAVSDGETKGMKTQPTKLIESVVAGAKDASGNTIVHVLAKFNEYAIYEIEHGDINNRLRVLIDGHTDESERVLQERYHAVKQKYIEAKGLLYRSANYGMMKNRVAHTLSTCLNSSTVNGESAFDELIKIIEKEHESIVLNRAIYVMPAIFLTATLFLASEIYVNWRINEGVGWQIITALLGASLGGSISILLNIKSLHFEEFKAKEYYALIGLERIFLSYIAGAIAFVAIKAGVTLPALSKGGYWSMMMVMVVAAFSESFVPSVLGRVDKDAS